MIYVGEKEFQTVKEAMSYLEFRRELTYGKRYDVPESKIQAKACPIRQKREPILGSYRWFREHGIYPQGESLGSAVGLGSELLGRIQSE